MNRCWLVFFALSSCAWAGKVAVTISPFVPSQCAAFITNVDVTALEMNGSRTPVGTLTKVDLAPLQLSQIVVGAKTLPTAALRTFELKLSHATCITVAGVTYPIQSPRPVQAQGRFTRTPTSAFVLLLDLRDLRNDVLKPFVKRLNIARHVDDPPGAGRLNGLVLGSNKKSITLFVQ